MVDYPKINPFCKTIPKKNYSNFTLKDSKLNKLKRSRLIIYAAFLKGLISLKKLLLL